MDNVTPLKKKPPKPRPKSGRLGRRFGYAIAAAVVGVMVLSAYFSLYVDWLWFGEVGLRTVFWTRLWWEVIAAVAFGGIFFAIFYGNAVITRRMAPRHRVIEGVDLVEYVNEGGVRVLGRVGLVAALVLSVIVGLGSASQWMTIQKALHGQPFGIKDPIFHHDYSFYVFSLPLWHSVWALVVGALVASLIFAVAAHLAMGSLVVQQQSPSSADEGPRPANPLLRRAGAAPSFVVKPQKRAVAHISALLAAVFLVGALGSLFRAWDLLYSRTGFVAGAGYTDIHARLPGARITLVIALALGVMLVVNVWRRRWQWPVVAIVVWIVALVLVRGVWPGVMQWLVVNPNQQEKERPYIANNLEATRAAYKLAAISEEPYPLKGDLTPAKLAANQATLRNIRLWDPGTLLTSYRQLQELKPYYFFTDVDVDRYKIAGVNRQTMLSARELNLDGLPATAQTWVNRHIGYTHGFGVVVSPVNQVTSDGSPAFFVKDVPPQTVPGLEIDEPRIYYGELGTDYKLVKTTAPEFDYPGASGDYKYGGTGGIPIGSTWRQLAFAVRYGTLQFLTTNYFTDESRVMIRSDIKQRVEAAAPFLSYDHDPYMVVARGKLWWVVDAYTSTDLYPYSEPSDGLNYVRNSVKVVIDAYNGTMAFYTFEPDDPILKTYAAIFPGMFKPKEEIPQELLAHVRYPEDYFDRQAEMFTTYHVTEPDLLYDKGNQWQIPDNVSLSGAGPMSAYYTIMRLPKQQDEEFVLMMPFVPNGKQNMIAWLGARSDVPQYGQAVTYEFPQSVQVYGPSQVEGVINQDTEISSQFTLWGQQGSSVIMGNLLVMPIEDSLLYVQPLYLQASETGLPQFKRVIVFYQATTPAGAVALGGQQQRVVMTPSLGESLAAIFGQTPAGSGGAAAGQPAGGSGGSGTSAGAGGVTTPAARALVAQANSQYEAAQKALKAGDWTTYGQQIDALGQTLDQLSRLQ